MNWKILGKRTIGILGLALLVPACTFASGAGWLEDLDKALTASQRTGKPVLIDFQAPWCYSCYYMDKNVLSSKAFKEAAERLVPVKIDVDQPAGLALKKKYRVTFLPTYVLVDSKGKDIGRIIGEQTKNDFMARLNVLLKGTGGPEERAIEALKQRLASKEYKKGQDELSRIPKNVLKKLSRRSEWRILKSRLSLRRAAASGDPAGLKPLRGLLKNDSTCELAYDIYYAGKILKGLPEEGRRSILALERPVMERLVRERVFAPKSSRCADGRTVVDVLEGIYAGLKLEERRRELLEQAVVFHRKLASRPGEDRNLDDNYRYFLHAAKKNAELEELYPRLIKAYPHDYVYAYRYARFLSAQGRAKDAFKYIKKADRLAYGANRLAVTRVRAKILSSLGKKKEALKILRRDIRWGKKAFPKSAGYSEALLKELQGSSKK